MNNLPHYQFGLAARLMQANGPCVTCQKNAGFTLKNHCEACAPIQEIMDTTFALLHVRTMPSKRPGFYEVGFSGLDQLEASLVTLARHLGLNQNLSFGTDRSHLP